MTTSVVIPTHNRAELVAEAIRSVLTLPAAGDREVVVVDDGSTDETPELLRGFGEAIRVVTCRHGERSRARNAGVESARGEFIHFLDDDDLLLPEGLPALERRARDAAPDEAVVYGRARYVKLDAENPLLAEPPATCGMEGWVFDTLTGMNFITMGAVLARRRVILDQGAFDVRRRLCEDWDLWLRVATTHRFAFVDIAVADIRLHGTNTMRAVEEAGRATEDVRQSHLLGPACLSYARARRAAGDPAPARRLAEACGSLANRRWWEGDLPTARRAVLRGLRLDASAAVRRMGPAWRAFVPLRKPRWLSG